MLHCRGCGTDIERKDSRGPDPVYCTSLCRGRHYMRAYRQTIPVEERRRTSLRYNLQKNYGIGIEEYEARVEEQGGRCAICGRVPDKRLYVDHDHATGAVRGLLCTQCNFMLGNSGDRPDLLRAGADYLEMR